MHKDFDTLSYVRRSRSLLGVMRTYSTSIATAYGDAYKMEYVCQRVIHSWVAVFQHIEAPRDCVDVEELSLPFFIRKTNYCALIF